MASQITLLVSIPLIVLLALAAVGSLWLNRNARLQNESATNSALAVATATAVRAIETDVAEALLRAGPDGRVPDPFESVVRFERRSGRELRVLLPPLAEGGPAELRRMVLTGPGEVYVSGPLIESTTGYVSVVIAVGDLAGG